MNKSIKLMGTVKTNKNGTNYIDMEEGRIYLGKISGFKAGDKLNGKAICKEQSVDYPAQAAVGTVGQPGYRPAVAASSEKGWACVNFIDRATVAQDLVYDAQEAEANLKIALTQRKAEQVATIETADLWATAV